MGSADAVARDFFATCPKGLSELLAGELREFGADEVRDRAGGVHFRGTLEVAYRACLWSRTANRVLLQLCEFNASSADELYEGVLKIDWREHIGPEATLACEFTGNQTPIAHSHHATLRIKDAVVDQLRERTGARPSIDTDNPDVSVYVHAHRDRATLYIDLSGESLHRRGYRVEGTAAPLKENLAAGILMRAGWPKLMREGAAFLDPMCGSGTFVIEAALMARDIAPGLQRQRFGFSRWLQHDEALWQRLKQEALQRREQAKSTAGAIRGFDIDANAVRVALGNVEQAGLRGAVHIEKREIGLADRGANQSTMERGLLCVNPPYGERLGEEASVRALYKKLGQRLKEEFVGWEAAVLVANPAFGHDIGILARRSHTLWNGPIEIRLLRFEIEARKFDAGEKREGVLLRDAETARARPGAQMFANRLTKNYKELSAWARKENVSCYRVYDADMPEYSFAIDLYQTEHGRWLVVQEYAAPKTIEPEKVRARRDEALSALPEVLGVDLKHIHLRTRRRSKSGEQYKKRDDRGAFHIVEEAGLKFRVNFTDYLDTGLFLDHRPVRAMIRELAQDRRFLNLFAYTGTATVAAAAGGARMTTTVDLSNTYLEWAQRNLELNDFRGPAHQLVRADCLQWLAQQAALGQLGPRYGLIFLDPPTFSNSKKMQGILDVQRDHVHLLTLAGRLLAPKGILIFSTNHQRFELDRTALAGFKIEDISAASIPRDFKRHADIHQTYRLTVDRAPAA